MKKTILVNQEIEEAELIQKIKECYPQLIFGKIVKVIYIKGRIVNIICK